MKLEFELSPAQSEAVMSEATDSPKFWAAVDERVLYYMKSLNCLLMSTSNGDEPVFSVWAEDFYEDDQDFVFTLSEAVGELHDHEDETLIRLAKALTAMSEAIYAELASRGPETASA